MVTPTGSTNAAATGAAAPEEENANAGSQLGPAINRVINNVDRGPTSVPGEMAKTGLYAAAAGLGVAAAGVMSESRGTTTAGLLGASLGLAMAAYGSRGMDVATTQNAQHLRVVGQSVLGVMERQEGTQPQSETATADTEPSTLQDSPSSSDTDGSSGS